MNKWFRKIKSHRKFIFLPLLFLVVAGVFFVIKPTLAAFNPIETAASIAGWLIMQLVQILGKVLIMVMGFLIDIAQYNSFITAPAVSKGWIIVRDVCNMFFIAALLLIAFGTVLRVEKYSYKRTLGGLLMAAVLINFSKFICGFLIDITQVLMLTFVDAFKDAASGNFLQMLGMHKWLNFGGAQSATGGSALTGALFALILVIISLVVISIMMVVLAFRIVIIWLLVVLSPLVFVLNIFPGKMKSYSNMWWEKFTNQLIVGPVMAFFIWLSFAVASESSIIPQTPVDTNEAGASTVVLANNTISEAANPSNFAKFVVSIAMLVGSLLIAQQLGVAGGKLAGKAVGKMQAYATGQAGVLKTVKDKVEKKAKAAGTMVSGVGKGLVGGLAGGLGKFGVETLKKIPGARTVVGGIEKGYEAAKKFKANTIKKFEAGRKNRAQEINEKGDAAGFFTKVFNSFDRNFNKHGKKDRSVGQLAQSQRVKDTKDRIQGKNQDELRVLAKMGSAVEKMAAAILLAERGSLKGKSDDNKSIIKTAQTTMAGNPILGNQFDNHIKKNSDADLVVETQYNNLESASDTRQFSSDIKEGKVDLPKAIKEMNETQINNLVKNIGEAGDDGAAGQQILGMLSRKQAVDLGTELNATEGGRKTRDTLFNDKVISDKVGKESSDEMRLNYFKTTGRLDNIYKGDPVKLDSFIGNNSASVIKSINPESLKDETTVERLLNKLNDKDFKTISDKKENKKPIVSALEKLISKYNTEGKADTPNAEKARKNYFKLNKGEGIENIYKNIRKGSKGDDDKKAINGGLNQNIRKNNIKMEHLSKIEITKLNAPENQGMKTAIAEAMDFKKFAQLVDEDRDIAESIAAEFQRLVASSPKNSKYEIMLKKMKKSEFGEIFI